MTTLETTHTSGEFDSWLSDYREAHQRGVDTAFDLLCELRTETSDTPSDTPETDIGEVINEQVAVIVGHCGKLLGQDVRFPPNAFYLLTGISADPSSVIAEINQRYDSDVESCPKETIHIWNIARMVTEHKVKETATDDVTKQSPFKKYSYSDLQAMYAKALDAVEGWADYYEDIVAEMHRRTSEG